MKVTPTEPPRKFKATPTIELTECGRIELDADELVTFVTPSGTELDIVRKNFGYYGTPTLNNRLPSKGLRPALTRNQGDQFVILHVENGKEPEFLKYLEDDEQDFICWLDSEALTKIAQLFDKS